MPRVENPAWEQHTVAADKQEQKGGNCSCLQGLEVQLLQPRCRKSLRNRQLGRLPGHLSCDKALCSKIQPCAVAAVPDDVRDAIRSEIAAKANVNASAAKRKAQSAGVENAGDAERTRLVQGRVWHQTVATCQVNAALSTSTTARASRTPRLTTVSQRCNDCAHVNNIFFFTV